MKIIYKIKDIKEEMAKFNKKNLSTAFVPTMGALHKGHGNLIQKAKEENDIVIVSIFVNPIQFDSSSDLENYPRVLEEDIKKAKIFGANIIFAPSIEEMYPEKQYSYLNIQYLDKNLCGKSRKEHFKGVCTVVAKFFNIIKPKKAYFGKKDYQQYAIIKKMAKDMNFDTEIVGVETARSDKGLALSSRNLLLNEEEKENALVLIKAIRSVEELFKKGEREAKLLINNAKIIISRSAMAKIDYLDIVDKETLQKIDYITKDSIIAMAVFIGKIRLIDNKELEIKGD